MGPNFMAEPAGTQVRAVTRLMLLEKDYPLPSAQHWYEEIQRRYPLENSQATWTEKDVVLGLRGEIKHAYPGSLDELTELPDSKKEFLEGKNFNSAIRRLRENGYFLPPWRQEPFFEDEETSELGYSMEGFVCSPTYSFECFF